MESPGFIEVKYRSSIQEEDTVNIEHRTWNGSQAIKRKNRKDKTNERQSERNGMKGNET
jgi:hypothetical protein